MALSFSLFLPIHAYYYNSFLLPILIVSTVLLVQCAKKKAKQADVTTVKAKRPPPNVREEKPRKEGLAAVKDYQTLGNLDADIFLKEQNKKGATQKTTSKVSVTSKDKTPGDKTKAGAGKKDSSKEKQAKVIDSILIFLNNYLQADKTEAAGKDGEKSVKTAMVKTQAAPGAADKDAAATADKPAGKMDDKKEKAEEEKPGTPDQGGENYEALEDIEKPK
uniref:Uncharacterized protein n=1 Tax=Meloidogyne hapla TaxID=6305 RepID=A0A1I8B7N3_MELHA